MIDGSGAKSACIRTGRTRANAGLEHPGGLELNCAVVVHM